MTMFVITFFHFYRFSVCEWQWVSFDLIRLFCWYHLLFWWTLFKRGLWHFFVVSNSYWLLLSLLGSFGCDDVDDGSVSRRNKMATFTTWRKPYFYVFHFVAFLIVFAWGVSIKICSLSIFLAVCYGHFRQWCVLLPVSLYVKVFQCMLILSFLAICCSISSDSPRKRKGCSRVIKCRKLVTVSFYFCTILSSSSIVILISLTLRK